MDTKPVVLLLAGGKSTRFWPLTEKNMFAFLGKNLVERQIEILKEKGFHDLIIVASDEVFDWLVENSKRFFDFNINYIKQKENHEGMSGAVLSAIENYRSHYKNRSLYILNCNDIYDAHLHDVVLDKIERTSYLPVLLTGYKVSSYQPLGYLVFEGGKVVSIKEKPKKTELPSMYAKIVADYFENPADFFDMLIKESEQNPLRDDLYEHCLNTLLTKQPTEAVLYDGRWEILKFPWHILSLSDYFLTQIEHTYIDPTAKISSNVSIGEGTYIDKEVSIGEGSKVIGSYIGKGTTIGNNCLVRQSIVGENCVIGFCSEVARSYLGNHIWLHTNYIGDSILEHNISLGSGTVSGNLRLDEKDITIKIKGQDVSTGRKKLGMIVGSNVRFGVNVSIMPGVKIGEGSFIGPGVIVQEDLGDGSFCTVQQSITMKKNRVSAASRNAFNKT